MTVRTLATLFVLTTFFAACGPTGSSARSPNRSEPGGDSGPSPMCGNATCESGETATNCPSDCAGPGGPGFAQQATQWNVPDSGTVGGFFDRGGQTLPNQFWYLLDLDDDGRVELVQTADPSQGTTLNGVVWGDGAGPYWKVYASSADGFTVPNDIWTVPDSGTLGGFYRAFSTLGERFWTVHDLTGDGMPDLVQTADPAIGQRPFGPSNAPYWMVFRNTGAGFNLTGEMWPVPAITFSEGIHRAFSSFGSKHWFLADVNDDLRDDLIQTADDALFDTVWQDATGPYWRVYINTGTGFASNYQRWSVPDSGTAGGLFSRGRENGNQYWATLDLDGDGLIDLLHTADPALAGRTWGSPGSFYWRVYPGTVTGFAAQAQLWTVPDAGTGEGFFAWRHEFAQRHWGLIDLDRDGLVDLVQTGDTAVASGVWSDTQGSYWKVYANIGTAFAQQPQRWIVPESNTAGGFFRMSSWEVERRWSVNDIDGDGSLDLVQTAQTADQVFSNGAQAYWQVFRAQ